MRASRRARTAARSTRGTRNRTRTRKRTLAARASKPVHAKAAHPKPVHKVKVTSKLLSVPEPVLLRFCKSGWAVLVEKQPNQQGTRFVCPFCTQSHRVSGPVRGFRKVRREQWIKLRRVDE
jgi:hypothetical protein